MRKKNLAIILLLALVFTTVGAYGPAQANKSAQAQKPALAQPHDLHGEGSGHVIHPAGRWDGTVWAHYDENGSPSDPQGIWEVGIEGLSDYWYTMGFVDTETFNGNILIAKGTFEDVPNWPLHGRKFVWIANLKTMKWILNGDGFHFKGEIEVINAYED